MRFLGRFFLVLAGAMVPAVVAPIGCIVDSDRFPGKPNDVPNGTYNGNPGGSTSSSSSSSSSGSTSSSSGSTSSSSGSSGSVNDCQCAATIVSTDPGECGKCTDPAAASGGACFDKQLECSAGTACTDGTNCVLGCTTSTCIADCLAGNALYAALIACQCSACATACSVATPIACVTSPDGGAGGGGAGGADAGDGG